MFALFDYFKISVIDESIFGKSINNTKMDNNVDSICTLLNKAKVTSNSNSLKHYSKNSFDNPLRVYI